MAAEPSFGIYDDVNAEGQADATVTVGDRTARPEDDADETADAPLPIDDGYDTMTESEGASDDEADASRIKSKSRVVLKQRLVRKKKIRYVQHAVDNDAND